MSHPNAHVVNRPLHKTRKSIPKFSSGKNKKKLFKNVTLQIPNLILPNRMLKLFPILCNVNLEAVFSALNNTKKKKKKKKNSITLHDSGNILLANLPRQNLKSGKLNF